MKTKLKGKFIIGFNGKDHTIIRDGEVVYEDNTIVFVGQQYPMKADQTIETGNAVISPGFIDLDALGDIDHAILDMWVPPDVAKGLEWSEEYFNIGRHEVFTREEEALKRRYALTQLILNGITTAMPIAGEYHKEWAETYEEFSDIVDIAADLGLRVYLGPSYRSGVTVAKSDGTVDVIWNEENGIKGLHDAVEFVERFDGTHGGLVRGFLAPCRIQTCTPDLLRRTSQEGNRLECLIRLHACQEPNEIRLLREWYGQTPLQFLEKLGFLNERTLIPHAIYINGHHPIMDSGQDELGLLRLTGTTVIHCPLAEARYGAAMNSFEQYSRAGINIAMGTDTFPPDMIRGMDYGSSVSKILEGDASISPPADFFRAATLGGARALGRDDLGRLSPGAKADIVVIDLNSIRTGVIDDPIRTVVFNTTGNNVRTVIINGRVVMQDWKIQGQDMGELQRRGQAYFEKLKSAYPERDYLNRTEQTLFPASFDIVEP